MENTEKKPPELSLADLQNIRTLIDISVKRGTFVAGEMSSVGAVYDRLSVFLDAVREANTPQEQPTETITASTTE